MNSSSSATAEAPNASRAVASAPIRPFYWSVRRELWENRALYLAPLIVAVVVFLGFIVSAIGLPERRRAVLLLDPAKARAAISEPYDGAAMLLIFTAFLVGVFYCLDALHGERRDRSILFWKSLPVSDLTTVLSKVTVPLVVLPLVAFAVIVATQFLMLLWTSVLLIFHGMNPGSTWTHVHLFQDSLILFYGLVVLSLWHAPIYGWLLLVSSWARRATFLWAVLPWLALAAVETIAFRTVHVWRLLGDRLMNWAGAAFEFKTRGAFAIESLSQLSPGKFLGTPGLWIGLAFAAVFLAAAVRLRRYRGPI